MGESITEATVSTILKESGAFVAEDEEILEFETDKVNQVLYAPHAGKLSLSVNVDDTVTIGQVIGHVDSAHAEAPAIVNDTQQKQEVIMVEKPSEEENKTLEDTKQQGSRIDKGRFLDDLLSPNDEEEQKPVAQESEEQKKQEEPKAAEAPQKNMVPPAPRKAVKRNAGERKESREKMSKIRRVIASRLVEAQHEAAMLTTFNEVDMTQIMTLRSAFQEAFKAKHGTKLGFMSFFVRAAVSALETFPMINSYIDGEDIVTREYYDIGIAIGTSRGLFVPVLRNCDDMSFADIENGIIDYAVKSENGAIDVSDLQGGGFTITNGGVYGSLMSTPILNPPQCAILGMHTIQKRPVVIDGAIVARDMMYLALTYDHRIVDGKEAVTFLTHIKEILENPASLALEL